jgi:hypothetical protein
LRTFKHSGAQGDIIYSLPTIKALGGGVLYLNLPEVIIDNIKPLLITQPYIKYVHAWKGEEVTEDLDLFRKDPQISWKHLVESHLNANRIAGYDWKTPWLKMSTPAFTWLDYAVVNMTPRYPAANFDWEAEIRYLKSKYTNVFFVGDAKDNLHNLPQIQCATALQLAEVIHNSQVFVGNQSFALSIAEGLGHQYRMVRGDNHTNCDMHTPNETIINA